MSPSRSKQAKDLIAESTRRMKDIGEVGTAEQYLDIVVILSEAVTLLVDDVKRFETFAEGMIKVIEEFTNEQRDS